jgi:ABC-type anion transport system duplicated permease subunit
MKIAKAIVAAAVPLIGSLVLLWATGEYDADVIGAQVVALITAVMVYLVPNEPRENRREG